MEEHHKEDSSPLSATIPARGRPRFTDSKQIKSNTKAIRNSSALVPSAGHPLTVVFLAPIKRKRFVTSRGTLESAVRKRRFRVEMACVRQSRRKGCVSFALRQASAFALPRPGSSTLALAQRRSPCGYRSQRLTISVNQVAEERYVLASACISSQKRHPSVSWSALIDDQSATANNQQISHALRLQASSLPF